MRFKTKLFKDGDTRLKTWFAIFPVTVWKQNCKETRWLEKVTVYQHCTGFKSWINKDFVVDD